jgi:hypothetical protein
VTATVSGPHPYRELDLDGPQRSQIEAGLCDAFGLTSAGAAGWVETSVRNGVYFGCTDGDTVVGSFAAEGLDFARGDERRRLALLQSHFIRADHRGRGWGVTRDTLTLLRERFAADGVILSLYDEPLRRYWGRLGFEVEQEAAVVPLAEHLRRAETALTVVLDPGFVAEKVFETEAIGGRVERFDGLLALTHPGDDAITELLTLDPAAAAAAGSAAADAAAAAGVRARRRLAAALRADRPVRLRTVLTWPCSMGLFVPFDV